MRVELSKVFSPQSRPTPRAAGIFYLALASLLAAGRRSDFEGTWVLRLNGQNLFKLTLTTEHGRVTGSLTRPIKLTIGQDGDVQDIGPDQVTLPVQRAKRHSGRLELSIGGDSFIMTLKEHDRALLALPGMRPWTLERAPAGSAVVLATSLSEPDYPLEIRALRRQLRDMVKEDQDARLAFDKTRFAAADERNRPEVLRIFSNYGWVTYALAGKDAAHDFWLLVQHQTPEIQRRLLPALETAARSGNASMSDYAYLYDRVQVGLGKPQRWGTQTRCENGKPALAPVSDRAGLDARRKELFMLPVREYLRNDYLVKLCAEVGK
jgi:uncharacterized protein DUF6624